MNSQVVKISHKIWTRTLLGSASYIYSNIRATKCKKKGWTENGTVTMETSWCIPYLLVHAGTVENTTCVSVLQNHGGIEAADLPGIYPPQMKREAKQHAPMMLCTHYSTETGLKYRPCVIGENSAMLARGRAYKVLSYPRKFIHRNLWPTGSWHGRIQQSPTDSGLTGLT